MPNPAVTDGGQAPQAAPVVPELTAMDRAERDRHHLEAAAGLFDTLLDIEEKGSTPKPTEPKKPAEPAKPAAPAVDSDAQDDVDAALLEDEEPASTEEPATTTTDDDEPAPAPTTYKVKVDGQEQDVTLDELLNGYSRTSDYTRKTMEVAEQRKALETEQVKARESLTQYGELLKQAEQMLTDLAPKEPDWNALRTSVSSDDYQRIWTDWQRLVVTRKDIAEERTRAEQKQIADFHTAKQAVVAQETQLLVKARPELSDPMKLRDFITKAFGYAKTMGYTPQQMAGIDDHRILLVLSKAAKFDAAMAKKAAAVPVNGTIKPAAPGAKATPKKTKSPAELASARVRKDRTPESLADLIYHTDLKDMAD